LVLRGRDGESEVDVFEGGPAHVEVGQVDAPTYADDRSVIDALRAGARGYLTKDAGAEEIRTALNQLTQGQAAIDPAVQHHLLSVIAATEASRQPGPAYQLPDGLTPREAEVLKLIAQGLSNAEIAERLVVNESTIKSHINHLFAKTGVRDRAQAVLYAYQHGLTDEKPARS
jgi:DNA-binding NarL/FixJ family response regulator